MSYTLFPDEIKEATSAINYKIRWRIVELLQETEKLAYTELLKKLKVSKGSLNHHLTKLMEAGILDNYAEGEFRGPYSSYYKLSTFGIDFTRGLLSSVEVATPIQRTRFDDTHRELSLENLDEKEKPIESAYIQDIFQSGQYIKTEAQRKSISDSQDAERQRYFSRLTFSKMTKRHEEFVRCIK